MYYERANCRAVLTDLPSGTAPDWIMVLPPGPDIVGVDGRRWTLPDPNALVREFNVRGLKLVIDWEHLSETVAQNPQRAPAAAWIVALEVRDGAIWGRVEWTAQGRADVEGKSYRYISPSFDYSKTDNTIVRLTSVGLVHAPNLNTLPALNGQSAARLTAEEREVCERMGYSEAEWIAFKEKQGGSNARDTNRGNAGGGSVVSESEYVRQQMGYSRAEWDAFQARR